MSNKLTEKPESSTLPSHTIGIVDGALTRLPAADGFLPLSGGVMKPAAAITFNNGSLIQVGRTDGGNGGGGGVAQVCSLSYELKWEAGRQYIMDQNGFSIREVRNCFGNTPTSTDDTTKGFYAGSRWITDDGVLYVCTSSTENNATWVIKPTASRTKFRYLSGGTYDATLDDLDGIILTDINSSGHAQVNLPLLADAAAIGGSIRILAGREYSGDLFVSVYAQSTEWSPSRFRIGSNTLFSLYSTGVGDYLELMPISISGTFYWQVVTFNGLWQDRD